MNGLANVWHAIVCWAQGHNLVGMELPYGWSQQRCQTCGRVVEAFRR